MKMTIPLVVLGGVPVIWASVFIAVILPAATIDPPPSELWRPWTKAEQEGHELWVNNGCHYCHSQYIRVIDRGFGSVRIAEAGDYYAQRPRILGSERTGPDLSQEGGMHPDSWQIAHFVNPRWTRPNSLMPSWAFLGMENLRKLTAYVQSQGLRQADVRMARQRHWGKLALEAYLLGPDKNVDWLHAQVPPPWRPMPNPYPATEHALARGRLVYQKYCIGCHGPLGDGNGPAARYIKDPPPLNFTVLRRNLVEGKYIGGILYYQVMNGITGSAMPYFKHELESEKIWDVSNWVAVSYIGYTDADIAPEGIDAAYEEPWLNPYTPPVVKRRSP